MAPFRPSLSQNNSTEAQITHLAPQLSGIVTAILPTLVQKSTIFFDGAGPMNLLPLKENACAGPAAHNPAVDPHRSRNCWLRHSLAHQSSTDW